MFYLGLDWGTTSVRAYRFDANGTVVATRSAPRGILSVDGAGGFDRIFIELVGDWILNTHPIAIACGMVGSAQGWREVPYAELPGDPATIGGHAVTVMSSARIELRIIPGLAQRPPAADVMRGEETKILGALDGRDRFTCILPGTHCKWAEVSGRTVRRFNTYMTGELFAVLLKHSILGRVVPVDATVSDAGFRIGLEQAARQYRDGGAMTHHLFTARSRHLLGEIAAADVAGYLSGLLVGSEVLSGVEADRFADPFVVIADPDVTARYRVAFSVLAPDRLVEFVADTAPIGLWRIATVSGWWPESAVGSTR